MAMSLQEVVPWGRSFSEYQRMFAMSDADLAGTILGCGDGPASFNAELTARGGSVISIDPLYAFAAATIRQRVQETHATIVASLAQSADHYLWTDFHDPAALGAHRLATMERFLADYAVGRQSGRYQPQRVPSLTFPDGHFTLALSSHFLLLYSEQLSFDFHRAALDELCRVATEVRLFPLLDLACRHSVHIAPLQAHLAAEGYQAEIVEVPYEFQRGGNQMLRIGRSCSSAIHSTINRSYVGSV